MLFGSYCNCLVEVFRISIKVFLLFVFSSFLFEPDLRIVKIIVN